MAFKKILNKVKDTHSQLKEKIELEKKQNSKSLSLAANDSNKVNIDGLKLDESTKKGLGIKEDLFIQRIEAIEKTKLKSYRVEKGDSLKSISGKVFEDNSKWIMLHKANIHKIPNPTKLIEGMILNIPEEDEFDNFYNQVSKKGNYIVQPEDNINTIAEKIFSSRDFVKKLVSWNYFKFTKDIYPGKEVDNLKYLNLEYQLENLVKKYNIKAGNNLLNEQRNILLSVIANIARQNKVPPVVMMIIANLDKYWQNCQLEEIKLEYKNPSIDWQPMMLNDEIYKEAFPKAAMDIEFNISYSAGILKELRKSQKNWPKAIVSFYLESPIGIGKPEEQKVKAKKGIEIIKPILKHMENKDFIKSIKSRIIQADEHDITFELLYNELQKYKEFISEKYL